ncbi:hypothetical protein SAMN05216321_101284 [Cupriavidus sp. OV038]|jgi:ABC-type amino acid transport substrate-binding protein|nr:hypothetical protein SAMN05216321_101284 [Cupriavidus sp. OV038]SFO60347.1 hypothetical protein SAMN05216322_101284 [Cupriavidus sp. OV096]
MRGVTKRGLLVMAAAGCLAACVGATPPPAVGARIALTGEVRIIGNAPHPMAVLQVDDQTVWELTGISVALARPLVGRRATVRGTVRRAPAPGSWMPALEVESTAPP